MSFLTLNGATIRVRTDAAQQKDNEHRLDRERMFDGAMRMTRGGVFRQWDITTALLDESTANTILALVRSGNVLTASGDIIGTDPIGVVPVPGGDNPVQWAGGFKRQLTFTLHEQGGLLPADTTAVPWLFLQRGVGYWQDASKTVPAIDGDPIWVWEDQMGSRDGLASNGLTAGGDIRPVRDGSEVHFGIGPASPPSVDHGRTIISWPSMAALSEVDVMIGLRGALDPPATANRCNAFTFNTEGAGSNVSAYPYTDGHIRVNFGSGTSAYDVGDPVGADLTSLHVLNINASSVTGLLTVYFDNVQIFQNGTPSVTTYTFDTIVPNLGWGYVGNTIDLGWDGWVRDLLIVGGVTTPTQRRSWYDYIRGATDFPPLPI